MRRTVIAVIVAAVLLWGGYRAWRAHYNLVTLNVRDMDVRKVVSKIEWQTWERIIVNSNVNGKVTFDVKDVPLEEVLGIIALQLDGRWTALYPIYSKGPAVVAFKKLVRGDIPAAGSGWTNLLTAPAWRGTMGGFISNLRAGNKEVSVQIQNRDLGFAALALSRFAQAQVVAEDGANAVINLTLRQEKFEKAVAAVARQAHRKWDVLYTLQPLKKPPRPAVAVAPVPGTNAVRIVDTRTPEERAAEREAARTREFEAALATMTPQERAKAEADRQAMEDLRNLPPDERQQRMQDMAARNLPGAQPDFFQRAQNRLKNSTPDQRVERSRARLEKQRKAQQAQPAQ